MAARGEEERRVELLHQADRASLAAAGLGENNDSRTAAQRCAFLPAAACRDRLGEAFRRPGGGEGMGEKG